MSKATAAEASRLETYSAPGRPVVVIDTDPTRRDVLVNAVSSLFRVTEYPDIDTAIARTRTAPAAVLIGDGLGTTGRQQPVRRLRGEPAFARVPLVRCVFGAPAADDAAADKVFDCRRSTGELPDTVVELIDRAVEASWDALPEKPRRALRQTLSSFRAFSALVEVDAALNYKDVTEACAPVIEAVAASGPKDMFEGLRSHNDLWYVHSVRVATLLALFGHTIGATDDELMILACGGLVHDFGKITMPPEVAKKVGPLTPEETVKAHRHVDTTIHYLENRSDVPKGVVAIAARHHERIDGSGYPHGLKGSDLDDLARMAAIVDVFAALTERRSYRASMSPFQALEVMQETIREQLDQRLVRLFRDMLLKAAA
jgi:HD-GYP domain-containing protein (c-di-GMP phosphodiesterase class II)